jgi:hypothetical protein
MLVLAALHLRTYMKSTVGVLAKRSSQEQPDQGVKSANGPYAGAGHVEATKCF